MSATFMDSSCASVTCAERVMTTCVSSARARKATTASGERVRALDNASLRVGPGEFITVVGAIPHAWMGRIKLIAVRIGVRKAQEAAEMPAGAAGLRSAASCPHLRRRAPPIGRPKTSVSRL
jgi:hypothetical protein